MDMSNNLSHSLVRRNVAIQALKAAGIPNYTISKLIDNADDFNSRVAFNSNLTGTFIAKVIADFIRDAERNTES